MSLKQRVEKLESKNGTEYGRPSHEELRWACLTLDLYFGLVTLREINGYTGQPIDWLPYTDDERAFLAECEEGRLAKAQAIREREDRVQGFTGNETAEWLQKELATLERQKPEYRPSQTTH